MTVPAQAIRIVSDELWAAANAKLTQVQATYLRNLDGDGPGKLCKDGKYRRGLLEGRPRFGNDSKYLLVGLGQCGTCGGGLQVRKRFDVLYYECTVRRQRGLAVCDNRLQVKMALADRAILSLVETHVFGSDVIRAVLRDVMRHLQQTGTKASAERAALESAAKKLDRQQQNILNAIAEGGESRSLRVKLKEIEEQQAEVADRLRRLTGLLGLQRQDLARLEATALLKLKDWTGLIYKHPLQARAIVKKFVPGRFVFTPVRAGSAKLPRYEVTATANPSLILGAVLPALVPPATGPRGSGAGASQIGGDPGGKHAPGASRGGRADLLAPLGWSLEVDLATTITVDAA